MLGTTLGHYRIVERIGAGGMGEVYRARDERLDRDVAIKVLPEAVANDPERMRRFEREAKALAALNHPNIATIYGLESDADAGPSFLVMELLEGESLRDVISSGRLTVAKAVEYARAVADGLAAAHDRGIVHRDLKPENVFLTRDGRIKILDFGLAKLRQPEVEAGTETPTASLETAEGAVMGTVPYMAPEQVRGEAADHRSDLFALGCVLYEMLSNRRPFGGATGAETAAAILKEDPEPLASVVPGISPSLAAVVSRCLEKRAVDRFDSAHDLSLTLGALDTAASVPLPSQEASFVRRRWPHLLAVAIAAVIAVLFVFPPQGLFERPSEEPVKAAPPRIVVLPFENLGAPEDEYFADGITEELISRLAAVSGLQVISRTSAMYYKDKNVPLKQIGDELDVGYVLEGTIRWDRSKGQHGRVRITPQLIRVEDDSHLWSERYDRVLEDIFEVQSNIADSVTSQLTTQLFPNDRPPGEQRPTTSMEAYRAYLIGVQSFLQGRTRDDRLKALAMFELAVELDPKFAVAHAWLSMTHSNLYFHWVDRTPGRLESALEEAKLALQLEPGIPEGHRALGFYHYYGSQDYERALEEFELASKGLRNDTRLFLGMTYVLRRQGRWTDAVEKIEQWQSLDPQSYWAAEISVQVFSAMRSYARAEEEMKRAIGIAPDRPDAYRWGIENYLRWDGATDRARALLASAPDGTLQTSAQLMFLDHLDRRPASALEHFKSIREENIGILPREYFECRLLNQLGDGSHARVVCGTAAGKLRKMIEIHPANDLVRSHLGVVLAQLGQRDEALRMAQSAVEMRPVSKDAVSGTSRLLILAEILAAFGESDQALEMVERLLVVPSSLSVGRLRLDPAWDPLRDDPRFQALLEKYDTQSN